MKAEDYEKLKSRLYHESVTIMDAFGHLFSQIFRSISDQGVCVKSLIVHLKAYSAFTPIFKGEKELLLRDELSKLDLQNADVNDITSIVQDYCSFFNYRLLSFLVGHCGTDEDKEKLKQYKDNFAEYAKRRVIECPSKFKEINENKAKFVLKLDEVYAQVTLRQIQLLECDICQILCVSHLDLCHITDGCVQLTFQLPFFIQKKIFPLSSEQEDKFKALRVIRIDCENYHFTNSESSEVSYRCTCNSTERCVLHDVSPHETLQYDQTLRGSVIKLEKEDIGHEVCAWSPMETMKYESPIEKLRVEMQHLAEIREMWRRQVSTVHKKIYEIECKTDLQSIELQEKKVAHQNLFFEIEKMQRILDQAVKETSITSNRKCVHACLL